MDDLTRHISALRRLPPTEFEVLSLRATMCSVDEIAQRLEIEVQEALARLALLYDSLWLAHLPQALRRVELQQYFSALESLGADGSDTTPGRAAPAESASPPRRALAAVDEDERELAAVQCSVEVVPDVEETVEVVATPPALARIARLDEVVSAPAPRRKYRPSRTLLLAVVLVLLLIACIAVLQLRNDGSAPVLAGSNTPDTPTEPAIVVAVTESPSPALAFTASPEPSATATLAPSPTPSPTFTTTPVPTATVTPTRVPPTATTAPATATTLPATATQPAPTSPTSPTSPTAVPPQVVFAADWSAGLDGWISTGEWQVVDGQLEHSGGAGMAVILASFEPEPGEYAIEAVIELAGGSQPGALAGFALQLRGAGQPRVVAAPVGGVGARTYRLEVSGDEARFLVEGAVVSTTSSDGYRDPERVGLVVAGAELRVSSLVVIQ